MHKYAHILSPVRIGNKVLKNRIINSKSMPAVGDPAKFPNEHQIEYAANYARNGASIVTCQPGSFKEMEGRCFFTSEYSMEDFQTARMFTKMIERIHAYGSLASASTMIYLPVDVSISEIRDWSVIPKRFAPGPEGIYKDAGMDMSGDRGEKIVPPEITKEQIKEFIELFTSYCVRIKNAGFDMINIYASYNASILAKSLSPVLNQRTDEYGGSVENRTRLLRELLASIKKACGKNFPIEIQLSGCETLPGGYTEEDFVEYCKLLDEYVDIFQLRAKSGDLTHVNSYFFKKDYPPNLRYAEMLKKAGIKALIAPVGGFQDPDVMEKALAEGKCDLIAVARTLICEEDYLTKILEERKEDIVTCLGCDKCHSSICAINPKIGNPGAEQMFKEPARKKKVAVIGGGPAGLNAAATAAKRGHIVELFEQKDYLGGQLIHGDYISRKWSIKDFKDWLIRQAEKAGVTIHLSTKATPELIAKGGFDAVIAACGAVSKMNAVPVATDAKPWGALEVFGSESKLGKNVVIVGGAMVAIDAALYLTENGHKVTILTRKPQAGYDYNRHSEDGFRAMLEAQENISVIPFAQTTLVGADSVTYTDRDGAEHKLPCDSVVLSEGRIPLVDESLSFMGTAVQFYVAGDACLLTDTTNVRMMPGPGGPGGASVETDTTENGIRHSIFTGYMAASTL